MYLIQPSRNTGNTKQRRVERYLSSESKQNPLPTMKSKANEALCNRAPSSRLETESIPEWYEREREEVE